MVPLPLYVYFIAVSLLASLTIYSRREEFFFRYLKFFPPFLFLTLAAEVIGSTMSELGHNNVLLYNLFSVFEFCFYLLPIATVLQKKTIRRVIGITTILYAIIALLNITFVQKNTLHTTTYALGCLLIVAFCIYYFLELFRLPKSVNLINSPAFWICSGLLFFYCCSFPLFGFINSWAKIRLMVKNFTSIIAILNIFLYLLFTIAFLCVKTRKYTLSSS
jgi:hypothetical protein